MSLNIHTDIIAQLETFREKNVIPNIIFHGPAGCGKSTIVNSFIDKIYSGDKSRIKSFVMNVNCAHGKGIRFIREELKFFAKINTNDIFFKTVILKNADKLTIDAQSALRRCIESFSHTTRFFIIVEDKYKLLKPILSRFCELYVPHPQIDGKTVNLHRFSAEQEFNTRSYRHDRRQWLAKTISTYKKNLTYDNSIQLAEKLYERAYSALDLLDYVETMTTLNVKKQYQILICINKIKREFRNEKLLLFFILNFIFLRSESNLENIPFM